MKISNSTINKFNTYQAPIKNKKPKTQQESLKQIEHNNVPYYKLSFKGKEYEPTMFEKAPNYIKSSLNKTLDNIRKEFRNNPDYKITNSRNLKLDPKKLGQNDLIKVSIACDRSGKKLLLEAFQKNDKRKINEAIRYYEKSLELAENMNNLILSDRQIKSIKNTKLLHLTYCYIMQNDMENVKRIADKSYDNAIVAEMAGEYCFNHKDYEGAIEYLENCIDHSSAARNKEATAITNNRLGEIYLLTKKPHKALEYFDKALSIYNGKPVNEPVAKINKLKGEALLKLGQPDKAIECLTKSLVFYSQNELYKSTFNVLDLLGRAYYKNEDFPNAIEYYNAALLGQKDSVKLTYTHSNIGNAYFQENNPQKAIKHTLISLHYYFKNPNASIKDKLVQSNLDRVKFIKKFIKNKQLCTEITGLSTVNTNRLAKQIDSIVSTHYKINE